VDVLVNKIWIYLSNHFIFSCWFILNIMQNDSPKMYTIFFFIKKNYTILFEVFPTMTIYNIFLKYSSLIYFFLSYSFVTTYIILYNVLSIELNSCDSSLILIYSNKHEFFILKTQIKAWRFRGVALYRLVVSAWLLAHYLSWAVFN
jgi:hypothetical protein